MPNGATADRFFWRAKNNGMTHHESLVQCSSVRVLINTLILTRPLALWQVSESRSFRILFDGLKRSKNKDTKYQTFMSHDRRISCFVPVRHADQAPCEQIGPCSQKNCSCQRKRTTRPGFVWCLILFASYCFFPFSVWISTDSLPRTWCHFRPRMASSIVCLGIETAR